MPHFSELVVNWNWEVYINPICSLDDMTPLWNENTQSVVAIQQADDKLDGYTKSINQYDNSTVNSMKHQIFKPALNGLS